MTAVGIRHIIRRNSTSPATLEVIARALNVRVEWLQTGDEPMDDEGPAAEDLEFARRLRRLPRPTREVLDQVVARFEAVELAGASAHDDLRAPVLELRPLREERVRIMRLVGYVAAGEPWPDEELGEVVEVPEDSWCDGCALVIARGDSMIEEGITDGAQLVIRPTDHAYRKGQVVIATVDGGAVVKRYAGQRKGMITLQSANPNVPDIVGPKGRVEIKAVVIHIMR